MRKTILLSVFLILPGVSYAQSKQPVPAPPKVSQPNQQQAESQKGEAKPDQRGTDNLPLVVELIGTNAAAEKPNTNAEAESKGAATDWWLDGITGLVAVFTFGLAAFTFLLWRSTEKLWNASRAQSDDMKESLRIAKESADSTKDMVETMKDTARRELRAYLLLDAAATSVTTNH